MILRRSLKTSTLPILKSSIHSKQPALAVFAKELKRDLKREHPDCLAMIQIGDFYEFHHEDAEIASEILGIRLTNRPLYSKRKTEAPIPMAGIPVRRLPFFIRKFAKAGQKVAIVNQYVENKEIKRKIVRIVTPGTLLDEEIIDDVDNNFIASVVCSNLSVNQATIGLAWADVSTGEVFTRSTTIDQLKEYLLRILPKEILFDRAFEREIPKSLSGILSKKLDQDMAITFVDQDIVEKTSHPHRTSQIPMSALEKKAFICLDHYVSKNLMLGPGTDWTSPIRDKDSILRMDLPTRTALEIVKSNSRASVQGSLFHEMNKARTAAGKRLLQSRLESPLTDLDEINKRLDSVEYFYKNPVCLDVRNLLQMRDPVKALQRIKLRTATDKDLFDVYKALNIGRTLADEKLDCPGEELKECESVLSCVNSLIEKNELGEAQTQMARTKAKTLSIDFILPDSNLENLADLHNELRRALPDAYKIIKESEDNEKLDEDDADEIDVDEDNNNLENIFDDNKEVVIDEGEKNGHRRKFQEGFCEYYDKIYQDANYQTVEECNNLEQKYKRKYDPKAKIVQVEKEYFLEVPKSSRLSDPLLSEGRSTKSKNRYTNAELRNLQRNTVDSKEKLDRVEKIVFEYLCGRVLTFSSELHRAFNSLAVVDVSSTLAYVAHARNLVRPKLTTDIGIDLKRCRHLVVESRNPQFTANDLTLLSKSQQHSVYFLTGPNMGGKSTFLRSCALAVILAQAGSFVPVKEASIGVVDRLFARIGASDDIASNRSTFMVEMEETAHFLVNATNRSLVIVDELGRGSSPQEGIAIAHAVLEELLNIGCSLSSLEKDHPNQLAAFTSHVQMDETGADPIFTFEIIPGVAKSSYAFHSAKLAGIPNKVIDRAYNIFNKSETKKNEKITK